MPSVFYRFLLLLSALSLAGCALLSGGEQTAVPQSSATPPPTAVPTATPQPITNAPTAEPTPLILPTAAPSVTPWPLSADLYYLNDAGQVWRQSRLGDASAVATITRLDVQVDDYTIAPGGQWIAYRSGGSISINAIGRQQGQIIAQNVSIPPDAEQGRTLAWSPDGRRLAFGMANGFQVYSPSEGAGFSPVLFTAGDVPIIDLAWSPDGRWLIVTRGDGTSALYTLDPTLTLWTELDRLNGFVWLPDNRLAFAPASGGLAIVPPADLAARTFLVPEGTITSLPGLTGEGGVVFFVHPAGIEQPGFLHTGNPTDGSFGAATAYGMMTPGWKWGPTGERLYRPAVDGGALIDGINPLNGAPATFEAAGVPSRLQFGEPPLSRSQTPEIPSPIYFLARQAGVIQVWRLPGDGSAAAPLTAAAQDVTDFAVSPQGTQIAYTSAGTLYRQLVTNTEAEALVTLADGITQANPAWSPDGSRIAYANNGIWLIDINTGEERRLLRDQDEVFTGSERNVRFFREPQWSPDGQWLLLRVNFFEGSDLAITPVTPFGVVSQPQLLNQFGAEGEWIATNQVVVYGQGGRDSDPRIVLVTPGEQQNAAPTVQPLFDLPVADATLRDDDRVAMLRVAAPFAVGPSSVSVFSVLPNGSDLQQETSNYVISQPQLSPNGSHIVGLRNVRTSETGVQSGDIEVITLEGGLRVVLDNIPEVFEVIWGP